MKQVLQLEYLAGLALGAYLFSGLPYSWGLFAILFFVPDLGMLGYLVNPRIGALTYNLTHHFGVATALYIAGGLSGQPALQLAGTVVLAHLSFDRILGYGLKYADAFKHTHLGSLK